MCSQRRLRSFGRAGRIGAAIDRAKCEGFDSSSVPMLSTDRDFRIQSVNRAFLDLLRENIDTFRKMWPNIGPQNIIGSSIDPFHKNPERNRKILQDPNRRDFNANIKIGEMSFALKIVAVRGSRGEYLGSVVEWVDDTAGRVETGNFLSACGDEVYLEFSLDQKIIEANTNAMRFLGYGKPDLMGMQLGKLISAGPPNDITEGSIWENLRTGHFASGVFHLAAQDGTRVSVSGTLMPIFRADGKPFKVAGLFHDVTEAERTAAEKAAITQAIETSEGIVEFDLDGHVTGANDNYLAMLGYSRGELIGMHQTKLSEPAVANSPENRQHWDRLRQGDTGGSKRVRRVRKNGTIAHLQATYAAIRDENDKVVRIVGVVSDVSSVEEERQKAEARQKAQDAEREHMVDLLTRALSELSAGKLTTRIREKFADVNEPLRRDFNSAMDALEETIDAVKAAMGTIQQQINDFATAADDLSNRTENQAAALEETAASLEELTSSVRGASENAEKASKDVNAARGNAEESGRIVRQAVDAMGEIEKSSKQISQIIGVIEDIAFQTNLLALNAGVEAARAGEAGRGFAVVASEVRALAQRSSDAAKEIKGLISTSSNQVTTGVDLVRRTGESLETIVASVAGITTLVDGMAGSSRDQASGLSEINTAVTHLDQVTQQNAGMVERSSATSHSIKGEIERVFVLVDKFDTSGGTAQSARPIPAPVRPQSSAAGAGKPAASRFTPGKPAPVPEVRRPVVSAPRYGGAALAARQIADEDDWTDF